MKTVVAMALLLMLGACGKDPAPPDVPAEKQVGKAMTVSDTLLAMVRGHPHALKVCFESTNTAFFVLYSETTSAGKDPADYYHGWKYIEKVDFYPTSNGTFYVSDMASARYINVYPDISNLPCMDNDHVITN